MNNVSLLIKPASGRCMLRCSYCFYADVAGNRQVEDRGIMRVDTLDAIVKKALSEAEKQCVFGFQGGEPTLAGLDFFKALISFERKYNGGGVRIHHALQTNGILLDDAWAAFFKENNFLIGLSIDAEKPVHDEFRRDASGKGTHNRCLDAADVLTRHGVDFNILSVVTKRLAKHPARAYKFYKQRGFRHLQFIPCLDDFTTAAGERGHSLDGASYGKFLIRLFDLWYDDFTRGDYVSIRAFDNYVHMLAGHPPENCGMAGRCQANALIEADGSVYPCDFYALDRFKLGNILENSFTEMLQGEIARYFVVPSLAPAPECRECEFFFICRGGCRRDREHVVGGSLELNKYCSGYKAFFSHALAKMRSIATSVI